MQVESLHRVEAHGLEMIVAIDSTRRGPALGGCRWRPYPDVMAARRDAIALARAMTRKAALAGLRLGGGKAVVNGEPRRRTSEQLLAFGEFVQSLGGRYVTAADMGTSESEMAVIAESTSHVVGLPRHRGGCGDPSSWTARGVLLALEAALARVGVSLPDARVGVQGTGRVGRTLVTRLVELGARVVTADPLAEAMVGLPTSVERVDPEDLLGLAFDAFAPCGPGGVIEWETAASLDCRVVCGAANNPLASPEVSERLKERKILYVPDFLANAGGLIHLAVALEGRDDTERERRLRVIPENLALVLERAEREGTDPARAAEALAMERSKDSVV
jgi:glutamate dehydrogenase/leucine dehydrogenase